ncbi:MAG TPA: hypothetical protein VN408_22515 [Actinoplanes sp.]|nr:hypothetical protein [Actinoplanes sp.]
MRVGFGVLFKDAPPADLPAVVQVIAGGDAILAPAITRRLISEFADRPEPCRNPPDGPAGDL